MKTIVTLLASLFSISAYATASVKPCNTDSYTSQRVEEAARTYSLSKLALKDTQGLDVGYFLYSIDTLNHVKIDSLFLCGVTLNYFYADKTHPTLWVSREGNSKVVSDLKKPTIFQDEGDLGLEAITLLRGEAIKLQFKYEIFESEFDAVTARGEFFAKIPSYLLQ